MPVKRTVPPKIGDRVRVKKWGHTNPWRVGTIEAGPLYEVSLGGSAFSGDSIMVTENELYEPPPIKKKKK